MIEHKFFDLREFKNLQDAARELDKLTVYEGFLVLCACGKKNNIILLRRIIEQPQQYTPQPLPTRRSKKQAPQEPTTMFPNAVYQ